MAGRWASPARPTAVQALAEEEANRSLLIQALNAMKRVAQGSLRLSLDEQLELNAFVTSVKEVRQEAKKGLEETASPR
jgi:hypothetical protein